MLDDESTPIIAAFLCWERASHSFTSETGAIDHGILRAGTCPRDLSEYAVCAVCPRMQMAEDITSLSHYPLSAQGSPIVRPSESKTIENVIHLTLYFVYKFLKINMVLFLQSTPIFFLLCFEEWL